MLGQLRAWTSVARTRIVMVSVQIRELGLLRLAHSPLHAEASGQQQ